MIVCLCLGLLILVLVLVFMLTVACGCIYAHSCYLCQSSPSDSVGCALLELGHSHDSLLMLRLSCASSSACNTYLIFVIFFTQAKFLENKIYTEIYTVNCQFTQ